MDDGESVLTSESLKRYRKMASELTPLIYDDYKSFDVVKVHDFASKYLRKDDYILFAGAYHDASLHMLDAAGFNHLYGFDTNDMYKEGSLYDEPGYTRIKYYKIDIRDTHFPSNFFKAIFSLSVIEHLDHSGGDIFEEIKQFLSEARRILDDGGFLVITTNYNDQPRFKRGKNIFDKEGIMRIIESARKLGFDLMFDPSFEIRDKPVYFYHTNYTFIFLSFIVHKGENGKNLKNVNIISPQGVNGISIYSNMLKKRLEETGIKAEIFHKETEINNSSPTLLEFFSGLLQDLPENRETLIEMHNVPASSAKRFFYYLLKERSFNKAIKALRQNRQLKRYILLIRNPELLKYNSFKVNRYFIVPHIAYPDFGIRANKTGICIGSFGFSWPGKRFEGICDLAIRLKIPAVILISISNSSDNRAKRYADAINKKYSPFKNIEIKTGFFKEEEILNELKRCSHIIFNERSTKTQTSGSYRFLSQLGIPIIAVNSFQAIESQVYRVNSLEDISLSYLQSISEPVNQDDGLRYLMNVLKYDVHT